MRALSRRILTSLAAVVAVLLVSTAFGLGGASLVGFSTATNHGTATASNSAGLFGTPATQWYVTAQNARLSADSTQAASGFLDFCSGTQPAAGVTPSCTTPLCTITLTATPFHTPSAGTMTNNGALTCTGTSAAGAGGTAAGYVALWKANHTTPLATFSISTSGANFNFPSTTITTGEVLTIADGAWTLTDPAAPTGY